MMRKALSKLVWDRANASCEYCRLPQPLSSLTFEIDHVIARKHGGQTEEDNLALSCFYCNSYKGSDIATLSRRSGELVPLFQCPLLFPGGNRGSVAVEFGGRPAVEAAGSSLAGHSPWPPLPRQWRAWVNKPQSEAEVEALRRCIQRGRPFGDDNWMASSVTRLGLESAIRPRGRPRKES